MTNNGTHTAPPTQTPAPAFDFDAWQRLTRAALMQGEQHLDAARRKHAEAGAAIARMEQQMAILRRALALSPSATVTPTTTASLHLVPPPAAPALPPLAPVAPVRPAVVGTPPQILRGVRTGKGAGSQSAAYLLELARVRVQVKADRRVPGRRSGADGMAGVDLELDGGEALTPETVWLSCRGWSKSTVRDGLRRLMEDGLLERTAPGTYRLTHAGLSAGPPEAGMLPLREPGADAPSAPAAAGDVLDGGGGGGTEDEEA